MITKHGLIVDGSWNLTITSNDLNDTLVMRVYNNTYLSEIVSNVKSYFNINYSDFENYGFWCKDTNNWLNESDSTLFKLGLNASSTVYYLRKIRLIKVQLFNNIIQHHVDFSKPVCKLFKSIFSKHLNYNNFYYFSFYSNDEQSDHRSSFNYSSLKLNNGHPNMNGNNSLKLRASTSGYSSLSIANSLDNFKGSLLSIKEFFNSNSKSNMDNNNDDALRKKSSEFLNTNIKTNIKVKQNNNINKDQNNNCILLNLSLIQQNICENQIIHLKLKFPEFLNFDKKYNRLFLQISYQKIRNLIIHSKDVLVSVSWLILLEAINYHVIIVSNQSNDDCIESNDCPDFAGGHLRKQFLDLEINDYLSNMENDLLQQVHKNNQQYLIYTNYKNFKVKFSQKLPKNSQKETVVSLIFEKQNVKLYKENDFNHLVFCFNVTNSIIEILLVAKSRDYEIKWQFIYDKIFYEISTIFENEKDFIDIVSECLCIINFYNYNENQINETKTILEKAIPIFFTEDDGRFNVYNMPKVDLNELMGCNDIKDETIYNHLKIILRYNSYLSKFSIEQSELLFVQFYSILPRYNYRYFYAKMNDKDITCLIAINPYKFMLLNSYKLCYFIKPWNNLKTWSVNIDLNSVVMIFDELQLSFVLLNSSIQQFHEILAFYIWHKSNNGQLADNYERFCQMIQLKI